MVCALDVLPHWQVSLSQGRSIYIEGDVSKTLYRVEHGCVRLVVHGVDGNRQVVGFVYPPHLFGYCLDRRITDAEVVSDVDLTAFPICAVVELGVHNQKAAIELLDDSNTVFRRLAHHFEDVSHLSAESRVLRFLQTLARDPAISNGHTPPTIRLPMSQGDLASYLNLTPQTLSRAFRQLLAAQRIQRVRNRVFVIDAPDMA